MESKASKASRENGKKGGRPKGYAALEAEQARILVAKKLAEFFEPIVDMAIEQAITGDSVARAWLVDRAYGRPAQSVDHTTLGKEIQQSFTEEEKQKLLNLI
jgi:hypothetical protein